MSQDTRKAIALYSYLGLFLVITLIFGIGGWAAWASIHGAVIAAGTVVVEGHSKKVQHAEGGIVSEIFIKDGDKVKAGQLLLRLDVTDIQANLSIVESRLYELQARQVRLEAERDGSSKIHYPGGLLIKKNNPEIRKYMDGQSKLFSARQKTTQGKKEQLLLRIDQLRKEIQGLKAQQDSKEEQIKLIAKELDALRILRDKELVPMTRLLALEREASKLKGARGDHIAGIARAEGKISETRLSIIQIDQDLQTEVLSELRDVQTKIAEYVERQVAAKTKLRRTEIRAPISGFIHQLTAHTLGGVIPAREPVMLIVPQQGALEIEAQIQPQDIDQIKVGQNVVIRFSAFDQKSTPEIDGEVIHVSADKTQRSADTPPFYTVRVKLAKGYDEQLNGKKLKPGMPAETFFQTGARTALNYLIKPLLDQIERTFK